VQVNSRVAILMRGARDYTLYRLNHYKDKLFSFLLYCYTQLKRSKLPRVTLIRTNFILYVGTRSAVERLLAACGLALDYLYF
jgi:hypothetical protein